MVRVGVEVRARARANPHPHPHPHPHPSPSPNPNLVEHHVERARPPRAAERRVPVEQQAPVVQLRAVADEPG